MKHHYYTALFILFVVIVVSITTISCGDGTTEPEDTDAPVIVAGPTVIALDSSATISWTTNEPADSRVSWDTTTALSNETSNTTLTLEHEIMLTDLSPATKYLYQVTSTDEAGNSTSSEAGLSLITKHNFSTATAAGWNNFESHAYEVADTLFAFAIGLNATIPDGFNGAGWTKGRLGNVQSSVEHFEIGISIDSTDLEIRAGLSFALNAVERFEESILYARYFHDQNIAWTFPHDTTVTTNDLILLLAINYFNIADFDSSLFFVQILNPLFDADVSLPEGRGELFAEIERLKGII